MKPIKFDEQNLVLTAPPDNEDVLDLPVWTDGSQVVSKWQMTWLDRIKALFYGHIWISLLTNSHTQPPLALSVDKTIFVEPKLHIEKISPADVDGGCIDHDLVIMPVSDNFEVVYKCTNCPFTATEKDLMELSDFWREQ